MSSQDPRLTGRILPPITSRASVERDGLPNGSTSTSSPEPDQQYHVKPKNLSRAPRLNPGSSQNPRKCEAVPEEPVSTAATRTTGSATEIPFRQPVVGTVSGVISVENPLGQSSGSNAQATFTDLQARLLRSSTAQPTIISRRDSFTPKRPRHQESTFSNPASRWGRERLWGHHRPRHHNTEPNPVTGTEHDDQGNRDLHLEECDDGQRAYWRIIEKLQSPEHKGRTVKFDDFAKGLRAQYKHDREAGRAAVIEIFKDGRAEQREFKTAEALRDYFNARDPPTATTQGNHGTPNPTQGMPPNSSTTSVSSATLKPHRRIFILEDLPLNYVTVLGSRLHIHPDVFAGHYSCDQGWAFTHSLDYLPAGAHDKRRFKLRYSTLMPQTLIQRSKVKNVDKTGRNKIWNEKSRKDKKSDQSKNTNGNDEEQNELKRGESLPWLVQAGPEDWFNPKFNVVRGLETPTDNGNWDHRGKNAELEGQVSYWARTDNKEGWDVLLLVDPRFQEPHPPLCIWPETRPTNDSDYFHIGPKVDRTNRYPSLNDGCDLPPDLENWSLPSKHDIPSMNSLYHDILSHYQSKDNINAHITKNPTDCTWIIRKFVIMKWISYLNHLHTCFWHCRGQLFGAPDEDDPEPKQSEIWAPTWTEWIYTRLQSWGSDLEIYRIDITSNMLNLGIDPASATSTGRVGDAEAAQWRYIQSTLLQHKAMLKIVADNYVQVIGLRETRTSTTQAHQVGRLTILGTVFVPLSIISGILSMGDGYLPGKGQFWVYWAIAVPVLVVLTVSLLTGFWDWVGSWVDFGWKRRKQWEVIKGGDGSLLPRFRRRSLAVSEGSEKWPT